MQRLDPAQKTGNDVRRMFDAIAPRYDVLNRVLSAGSDERWRRQAVAAVLTGFSAEAPATVLDVCCGTGDLAMAFAGDARVRSVAGVDFSMPMVGRAARKGTMARAPAFAVADAQRLPVRDHSVDVVSVAFGLRNLVAPEAGIREFARVLRPGGRLAVLEFFRPAAGLGGRLFRWYFRNVLPRIGRLLTRGAGVDAYRYLPESVDGFATAERVGEWCRDAGLESISIQPFLFGAVVLVTGRRRMASLQSGRAAAREVCVA